MEIEKYTSYFHDGTIHSIDHTMDNIRIAMESAELRPEWNKDHIALSKEGTIAGYLHLEGVNRIQIDEVLYTGVLKKSYDSSDINHFKIQSNKVKLLVRWINYPPKQREETDIFTIEIETKKIYWENIPTLFDEALDSV